MLHIFPQDDRINENEMEDNPTNKPSFLSYVNAVVGALAFALTLTYAVYVAGGQSNTINRHDDEIKRLQQYRETFRDNTVTKEDFRRLESKVDQIVDRELRR